MPIANRLAIQPHGIVVSVHSRRAIWIFSASLLRRRLGSSALQFRREQGSQPEVTRTLVNLEEKQAHLGEHADALCVCCVYGVGSRPGPKARS